MTDLLAIDGLTTTYPGVAPRGVHVLLGGNGACRRGGDGLPHFSLFEALNLAENVTLGMECPPPQPQSARRIR